MILYCATVVLSYPIFGSPPPPHSVVVSASRMKREMFKSTTTGQRVRMAKQQKMLQFGSLSVLEKCFQNISFLAHAQTDRPKLSHWKIFRRAAQAGEKNKTKIKQKTKTPPLCIVSEESKL